MPGRLAEMEIWSGGCQCGAVRYRLAARPRNAIICHCRMCQKQMGNGFGAYAEVEAEEFQLSRGTLSFFRSSDAGERTFCRDCGTPLGYRYSNRPIMVITIGSLDRHSEVRPETQYGIESREPWFASLASLPEAPTSNALSPAECEAVRRSNRQHPDHDTDHWP